MNRTPEEIKVLLANQKNYIFNAESLFTDALAYIQQLESQVPKWISVEERLPETGKTVLCVMKAYKPILCIGWYDAAWKRWIVDYDIRHPVTHWMPLPEPPKEE